MTPRNRVAEMGFHMDDAPGKLRFKFPFLTGKVVLETYWPVQRASTESAKADRLSQFKALQ